jgi:hypothetical protein
MSDVSHSSSAGAAAPEALPAPLERVVASVSRPASWLWDRGFRFLFVLDAVALFALMVVISFVRFGFSFDWDTYPLSHYFIGFFDRDRPSICSSTTSLGCMNVNLGSASVRGSLGRSSPLLLAWPFKVLHLSHSTDI